MTVLLAATAATLFGLGTYLVLQRKLSRIIGIALLGHGANILMVTSGRRGGRRSSATARTGTWPTRCPRRWR